VNPSHLSRPTSTPFLYESHVGSGIVRGTVLTDANLLRKGGNNTVAYFTTWLSAVLRKEEGQGLAEYALILALIAVVAILALVFLGGKISGILSNIGVNI
jgi:pilus assembly protein Flp/PilA